MDSKGYIKTVYDIINRRYDKNIVYNIYNNKDNITCKKEKLYALS